VIISNTSALWIKTAFYSRTELCSFIKWLVWHYVSVNNTLETILTWLMHAWAVMWRPGRQSSALSTDVKWRWPAYCLRCACCACTPEAISHCRLVSVGVYVCRSVTVTVAICMQGHRLRIRDEKAQIGLVFSAVGAQNLTLTTCYFLATLVCILSSESCWFWPTFGLQMQNERIFSSKFVDIRKFVIFLNF